MLFYCYKLDVEWRHLPITRVGLVDVGAML